MNYFESNMWRQAQESRERREDFRRRVSTAIQWRRVGAELVSVDLRRAQRGDSSNLLWALNVQMAPNSYAIIECNVMSGRDQYSNDVVDEVAWHVEGKARGWSVA